MHKSPLLIALVVAVCCGSTFCEAADLNPFLAEASAFEIVVEHLPVPLKQSGLTSADIEERTEFICRRNRLPVADKATPWLYVRVSGTPLRQGGEIIGYTYNVNLYFKQTAKTLVKGVMHTVTTWNSRGTSGVAPGNSLRDEVKGAIQDEIEEFANAWMASHPRQ